MPIILFELFYTIWPIAAVVSLIPFYLLLLPFVLSESLHLEGSENIFLYLLSVWQAVQYSSAFLFLEFIGVRILQALGVIQSTPQRRTWGKVVLIHFAILFLLSQWRLSKIFDNTTDPISTNYISVLLTFLGTSSLFFFFALFLLKTAKHIYRRLKGIQEKKTNSSTLPLFLTIPLALYPLAAVLSLWVWLVVDPLGSPQASRFFKLNAAIKNTCYTDPRRQNCPHTLEEIGYIEPAEFEEKLKGTHMQYVFDTNAHLYTFVVRYKPTRAVVFDPRLIKTTGVDFKEYDVAVIGQDRLISPPDFPGPWTFPDWKY